MDKTKSRFILCSILLFFALIFVNIKPASSKPKEVTYTDFYSRVEDSSIRNLEISNSTIDFQDSYGNKFYVERVRNDEVTQYLDEHSQSYKIVRKSYLWAIILPALLIGFCVFCWKRYNKYLIELGKKSKVQKEKKETKPEDFKQIPLMDVDKNHDSEIKKSVFTRTGERELDESNLASQLSETDFTSKSNSTNKETTPKVVNDEEIMKKEFSTNIYDSVADSSDDDTDDFFADFYDEEDESERKITSEEAFFMTDEDDVTSALIEEEVKSENEITKKSNFTQPVSQKPSNGRIRTIARDRTVHNSNRPLIDPQVPIYQQFHKDEEN